MHQPVDGSDGHGGVGEDLVPLAERLVGGDQQRALLVTSADQLEQDAGLGLILGYIREVVEHHEVKLVELPDGGLEGQLAARGLQALREIGGAREQHAVAVLDEREADGGGEMGFSGSWRTDEQQVGAFVEPAVAGAEGHDVRLGEGRDDGEVEAVEGLAGRQPSFAEAALEATAGAVGDFVFGQGGQQARGGPAFAVGLSGELRPQCFDGGQAQFAEHKVERRGIDGCWSTHAVPAGGVASAAGWSSRSL